MQRPHASPDRVAELLVHMGRIACSEESASPLTASQWTCLRFLARANRGTRTPSAFASFQATSRGTASQTVKSLEERGLVRRSRAASDGRSVQLDLTDEGQEILATDPLCRLTAMLNAMPPADRETLLGLLSRLAAGMAADRHAPVFGTCEDCCHFTASGESGFCACMGARIDVADIDKLCDRFSAARPGALAVAPSKGSLDAHGPG